LLYNIVWYAYGLFAVLWFLSCYELTNPSKINETKTSATPSIDSLSTPSTLDRLKITSPNVIMNAMKI